MSKIPESVRSRVKVKATSEWPGDFEMQKHTIEKQFAAFLELEMIKAKFRDNDFVEPILQFSARSWPDDFEMELHTYKKQLESGIAFFDFEAPDVPSDVFEQVRLKAFSEWPSDHEMKLHTLKKQLEAWRNLQGL